MTVGTPQVIADFPFTSGGVGTTTDNCPAGNLIVVVPYPNALGDTITNVTDSAGNTYTKAVATAAGSQYFTCSIWYCTNCLHLPAGGTITISGSSSSIDFTAYSVANANGGLDVTNSTQKTTTTGSSLSLSSGSLAQADTILFAACFPSNAPATPTASGWTPYDGAYAYYKTPGSTSSQSFAPSWSGAARAAAVIAAFKGSSVTTHAATGALTGPGSTVSGSARHNKPHASSGALTGSGSTIAGSAAHIAKHAATGALTGQGSAVTGSAKRFRAHSASGTLAGPGSTVSGAATRFRAHPSSGALTGPGSAVAGAATRFKAHAASGTLTGPGAEIVGSAARFRAHAATGVITGAGAAIDGSADHATASDGTSHTASGVLIGPGSTIDGSSARSHIFMASGVLVGPGAVISAVVDIPWPIEPGPDTSWDAQSGADTTWTAIPPDSQVWDDVPASSDTWTPIPPSSDAWSS
jgi:hypothetical protein